MGALGDEHGLLCKASSSQISSSCKWTLCSRSVREMVRQYREELSCQTASNDASLGFDASPARIFLKSEEVACEKRVSPLNEECCAGTKRLKEKIPVSVQQLCWHETPIGSVCSPMQENTGTCTPLGFRLDDLADFQDLDRRAAEVLRRSQQVIEGGQACKSYVALISKAGLRLKTTQAPSYLPGNGHCSPHSSGIVEWRSRRNHCRARDVVARNFEEIDKILGESNLVMEKSSSSDFQHEVSDYNKVGREMRRASNESGFEPRQSTDGGAEYLRQEMEAREVAAINAANDYLNKGNGHFNILLSDGLLDNTNTHAEKELVSTCRRSLNASDDSVDSADQACYPSTFNTNNQQESQTAMSVPFATLESCNRKKICDKPVPTTSSVTSNTLSESKWLKTAEGDRQRLNNSGQLDSEKAHFASMVASKLGTWKYAEEFNFGESHLDSSKSLDLDGGLPMSSRNSAITTRRHRPSTVDTQQYPFPTKKKKMKKSHKSRDICSVQMPTSYTRSFAQEVGVHDPDFPVSESQSCSGRLVRGASHGSASLEDGMRQLSTEDLLLALENPRKVRAGLRSFSSTDQVDASCEGRRTYRPEQYHSPGKCSTSPTATEFESSFAGGLDGNEEESTMYSAILASLEQDHEEAFDRASAQASGSHRDLLKSNAFQRSKARHSELATQLLCSSAKCRGTKGKDNKSPAWMHSLNVRKPSKWRAMPITRTRLQASAASLIKGTVVIEELEERDLGHNQPKDAAANSDFKERGQEDLDCRAATASIPNDNLMFNHSSDIQVGNLFSAPVSKRIANGAAQIEESSMLSGQADIQVEPFLAHSSDSYLNHRIHGSNGLPYGISQPRILTVCESHRGKSCSIAQDSRFDNLPINSTFSSGLDCLISEVVHEWVEICSTPSSTLSACYGNQETRAVSPVITCSVTEGGGTQCPSRTLCAAEDGSSPEERLKIENGMQASETGKRSANQDLFRKVQGSKSLPKDSELVQVVRKNSVAALASVVQPLLADLQEVEIEETIVAEFEADETVRLLLEKLHFYETKIRALKNRRKGNFKNQSSAEN